MVTPAKIRKLPANIHGKDYVLGDLHGCYGLLERLLDAVSFDRNKDRLFSVGDLIDRGPESFRCLELLAEPWFYAVMGNHECMMLDFFRPYLLSGRIERLEDYYDTGFLVNDGDWVEAYFQADQSAMSSDFDLCLNRALNLPILLVVGEGESRFHVIHAELIDPDFRTVNGRVCLDTDIDRWFSEQYIPAEIEDQIFWGRTLMSSINAITGEMPIQNGLSITFCGHSYSSKPRQVSSHLCIDTGAFTTQGDKGYGGLNAHLYSLTLFDVRDSRWFSASYRHDQIMYGKH